MEESFGLLELGDLRLGKVVIKRRSRVEGKEKLSVIEMLWEQEERKRSEDSVVFQHELFCSVYKMSPVQYGITDAVVKS